ncbi:uncharacterized protein N7511_007142 [Penicillium nucicola]|uniref:uncharacterized protein n=1 Tax=Penicillium nucicola TaxID=1850975 RepID=UPI00254521B2|nr:uncharacterized protein N7511_007142 [Penicillium nucicola]KAJ5756960.1 hypothetical protein N7511_007142 [Penicillium nucicola]
MTQFDHSTTGREVVSAFSDKVSGRTFVITGASHGGIGAHVALCLAAAHPAEILLLGRSQDKIDPVIKEIQAISPATKVKFIKVDLASSDSVRAAAKEVASTVSKIDVLINNAGIMAPKYSITSDNVESQFGANYVGHFLLTNLLVPQLEAASNGARVVNVSSLMYQFSPVQFDDYNFSNSTPFNTWEAYGQSKTANILFAVTCAEKLASKGIKSYSLHPGNIQATKLAATIDPAEWPVVMKLFEEKQIEMPRTKTIEEGSSTTLAAALDPELDAFSGAFLDDCHPKKPLDYASDPTNGKKLWALTEKILGENFSY